MTHRRGGRAGQVERPERRGDVLGQVHGRAELARARSRPGRSTARRARRSARSDRCRFPRRRPATLLPLTDASAWPPTDPLRKYVRLPVRRSVSHPPASPARTPPEALAMVPIDGVARRLDGRLVPIDCRRRQHGVLLDRPHDAVGFSLGPDDPRAAASERAGHADGDVGAGRDAASSQVDLRPRAGAPLDAAGRRGLERHRERVVRATSHGHALVVAELDDGDRHGPRPRAAVGVHVARRAIAVAVAAAKRCTAPAGPRGEPRSRCRRPPRSLRRRFHRPVRTPRAARRRGTRRFPGHGRCAWRNPRAVAVTAQPRNCTKTAENQRWRNQRPSPSSRKTTRSRPSIVTTSQ